MSTRAKNSYRYDRGGRESQNFPKTSKHERFRSTPDKRSGESSSSSDNATDMGRLKIGSPRFVSPKTRSPYKHNSHGHSRREARRQAERREEERHCWRLSRQPESSSVPYNDTDFPSLSAARVPVKSRLGGRPSVKSRLGDNPYRTGRPLKSRENVEPKHSQSIDAKKLVKEEDCKSECSDSQDWESKMNEEETRRRQVRRDLQRFKIWHDNKGPGAKHQENKERSDSSERKLEYEFDEEILVRRHKQLEFGKKTDGYVRYLKMVPKKERTQYHPKTPNKFWKCSRRGWDTRVKTWRRQLHIWDPPNKGGTTSENFETASEGSFVSSTAIEIPSSLDVSPSDLDDDLEPKKGDCKPLDDDSCKAKVNDYLDLMDQCAIMSASGDCKFVSKNTESNSDPMEEDIYDDLLLDEDANWQF